MAFRIQGSLLRNALCEEDKHPPTDGCRAPRPAVTDLYLVGDHGDKLAATLARQADEEDCLSGAMPMQEGRRKLLDRT